MHFKMELTTSGAPTPRSPPSDPRNMLSDEEERCWCREGGRLARAKDVPWKDDLVNGGAKAITEPHASINHSKTVLVRSTFIVILT